MRNLLLVVVSMTALACTPDGVLRKCSAEAGVICPYAGVGPNGFNGDGHHRTESWFSFPLSITFSDLGPVAIADWNNHRIRVVTDDDTLQTVMGTDFLGDGDPDNLDMTPAGAPGTSVNLNHPTQHEYMADGRLLSASWHTHKLRTWDPQTGLTHVILGDTPGYDEPPEDAEPGEPRSAQDCRMNQPKEVRIDQHGDIYILDMRNERIRKFYPQEQLVRTVSGSGEQGYCGEGDALTTCWNFPKNFNPEPGGAMNLHEELGLLYVADTESHIIRAIDLNEGTTQLIAGIPEQAGFADGDALQAQFDWPAALARDGDQLFVADSNNHRVRVIDLSNGTVSTLAGTGEPTCPIPGAISTPQICDDQSRSGDGGPATEARLYRPFGVDLDQSGNVYISDSYNHRIRVVYR